MGVGLWVYRRNVYKSELLWIERVAPPEDDVQR